MKGETSTDEFIELVRNMRLAQKEYFDMRSWNALNAARLYEKAVDEFLKLNTLTHIEDDRQQSLF